MVEKRDIVELYTLYGTAFFLSLDFADLYQALNKQVIELLLSKPSSIRIYST